MTTDVLALREALLRDIHTTFCERSAVAMRKYTPQVTAHQVEALVSDRLDALIAAVRAETLAGPGVVDVAAVQKAVGILRDYSHGEECAVYAEDDDLVDVYDDPTNEACDCGLRDLILTLTGALPDVGATALALAATPPTPARERGWARDCYCNAEYPGCTDPDCSCSHHAPPTPALTAARLAVAMHETTMGCANHGSDWHSYHIGVARILFAALAATPPTPAPALTAARCGYLIRMLGLTPFICNRAEDDALHRSRTHPDAHSFLTATHTPERLLDAIEAQAIGEVEA